MDGLDTMALWALLHSTLLLFDASITPFPALSYFLPLHFSKLQQRVIFFPSHTIAKKTRFWKTWDLSGEKNKPSLSPESKLIFFISIKRHTLSLLRAGEK